MFYPNFTFNPDEGLLIANFGAGMILRGSFFSNLIFSIGFLALCLSNSLGCELSDSFEPLFASWFFLGSLAFCFSFSASFSFGTK